MCGIAGLYRPGADLSAAVLESTAQAMGDAIRHRGPDAGGTWFDPHAGVALAHRRLAVIDPSPAGAQPMVSPSGRWVMALNGEIYNFRELRRSLEGCGYIFRGHSDTEALLAAIEQWGLTEALQRSLGMFALALWDRSNRVLHLARDRMGEKPLYYGWANRTFLFGSELKALKAYRDWRAQINHQALPLLFRHNFIPTPFSIYEGISKLPAGAVLSVRMDRYPHERLTRYWSLQDVMGRAAHNRFSGSEAEAVERLDQLLSASVAAQMEADVPVGAFLSGGVDSSTIVALMQKHSHRPVKTFTVGFNEPGYDESGYARAIAQHLGTEHTDIRLTPQDALAIIPKLPALYDEPFSDASQLPTYAVACLARAQVKVALSGDGGDENFGGYNRYFLARSIWRKYGWVPASVRSLAAYAITRVAPVAWDRMSARVHKFLPAHLRRPLLGDGLHKVAEILRARDPQALYGNLISHWARSSNILASMEHLPAQTPNMTCWNPAGDYTEQMMLLDSLVYLPDDLLVKVDRASMGVGLETRAPFLDHRVVEFAWTLPLSFKLRGKQGKRVLRGVLGRYMPSALVDRPKMGFGMPIDSWLRGPLREWAEGLLDAERMKAEGFLRPEVVHKKWREHLNGVRNWQYHLWDVLMFQAWLERERQPACGDVAARVHAPATPTPASVPVRAETVCRGRVLYLVNDARFFLSHRLPIALAARAAGFEVFVATPDDPAARDITAHGLHFVPIEISRWGHNPWQEFRTFLRVTRLLQTIRPHVFHSVTIKPILYGCLAARLTRQPSVVAAISGLGRVFIGSGWKVAIRRWMVEWGYRVALKHRHARVIFQNPDDLDQFVTGAVVERAKTVLIRGSGVDLKHFAVSPLNGGTPIVMLASRMLWDKGVGEFVAAAELLRARGVHARFVLVGDSDPGNPSYIPRHQLEAWHRAGAVEWWGRREDMPAVLAQAYMVCLPSYREGLPKVLLEAAACGRPLIAADVPGCREVVRNRENGLRVPVGCSESLANAVLSLLGDRSGAQAMGRRSREIAEREFGFEGVVGQTMKLYEELLQRESQPAVAESGGDMGWTVRA